MAAATIKFSRLKWGGELGDQINCIYISKILMQNLKLEDNTQVSVKIGTLTQQVMIKKIHSTSENNESIIFVSPDLMAKCGIPVNHLMTLRYDKQQSNLSIGPMVGMLTTQSESNDSKFGSQEALLNALAMSSEDLAGFVYIFCPEDINWECRNVTGYFPGISDAENEIVWQNAIFPLPDVIYDRIPSRTFDGKPEVIEAKIKIKNDLNLPYFNPRFLDKWEMHQALKNDPDALPYLPPTKLVSEPFDILEYLNLYNSVFLKPTSGSLGKRVLKVEKISKNKYRLLYRSREKQTIEKFAPDFTTLFKMIEPHMGKKTFIVQKDLQLAKYQTGPFDIRVLMQKDMYGNWRRTKIYTRVAAVNSFLSNLSDGGQPKSIFIVLNEVFGVDFKEKSDLGEDIRNAIRLLPSVLEKATGETWGELGLDLGIDIYGKVWLIEINSKPFRALASEKGSTKAIHRSLMRPLEYAKFLAGFYRHSL